MPRYLGVDHGRKRIGLAIGETETGLATALRQFDSSGTAKGDAAEFRRVIEEYDIDVVVIGLPLNMDDTEGDQAKLVQRYGKALACELSQPIEFWDERLSSAAADEMLDQREELTTKKRKARRDALAAQAILQSFLDHQRGQANG